MNKIDTRKFLLKITRENAKLALRNSIASQLLRQVTYFIYSRNTLNFTIIFINNLGTITPEECKAGNYCPPGTKHSTEYPCPKGTYSDKKKLNSPDQCSDCLGGSYCLGGETSPTGLCWAGFYCTGGSSTFSPTDGVSGNVCPRGFYCENGTAYPDPCPAGTYGPSEGKFNNNIL